jgi:hypothetical protein
MSAEMINIARTCNGMPRNSLHGGEDGLRT